MNRCVSAAGVAVNRADAPRSLPRSEGCDRKLIVHAFKFLGAERRARFSGLGWPEPAGAWLEVTGPLEPCVRGVHACRGEDLPYWLDSELWRVELAGELILGETMVIAARGRLLSRVAAWNDALKAEFARFCVERAQASLARAGTAVARRYLQDVEALAELGELATAAYISALSAECGSELCELDAYLSERAIQAAWLVARLGSIGEHGA